MIWDCLWSWARFSCNSQTTWLQHQANGLWATFPLTLFTEHNSVLYKARWACFVKIGSKCGYTSGQWHWYWHWCFYVYRFTQQKICSAHVLSQILLWIGNIYCGSHSSLQIVPLLKWEIVWNSGEQQECAALPSCCHQTSVLVREGHSKLYLPIHYR